MNSLIQDRTMRIIKPVSICGRFLFAQVFLVVLVFFFSSGFSSASPQVAAGQLHSVVVQPDGSLWSWGQNDSGQLGVDRENGPLSPVRVGGASNWNRVAAGEKHTVALRTDGTLWGWGANGEGQLGSETDAVVPGPRQIGVANHWVSIAAGGNHTLALAEDGSLWGWGRNLFGQVGNGSQDTVWGPVRIGADHWREIAAGENHSLAIREDGSLWAWGSNLNGRLGTGDAFGSARLAPSRVGTVFTWSQIKGGDAHSLALREDGSLWAWGRNLEGQLGLGASRSDETSPRRVGSGNEWSRIGAGGLHSLAIDSAGLLFAWGFNFYGQLGLGHNSLVDSPARVERGEGWAMAAGGSRHTLAVDGGGVVWASGSNAEGQLGEAAITGSLTAHNRLEESFVGPVDLELVSISRDSEGSVVTGDLLSAITVTVRNAGPGGVPGNPGYRLELRLSADGLFGENDFLLGRFHDEEGLAHGAERTLELTLPVPRGIPQGSYYITGRIDPDRDLFESDRGNNDAATEAPVVEVINPVDLTEALDFEPDEGWATGGAGLWFGQEEESFDGEDAAQSPALAAGEEGWFEADFPGPAMLSFYQRADTRQQANVLIVTIDGVAHSRIAGTTEWEEVNLVLPAANNSVRWTYVQSDDPAEGEAVYVDQVSAVTIDKPDFVIESVEAEFGEYILMRDRLTVTVLGRNQGTFSDLPPGFRVTAKLVTSPTPEGYADGVDVGDLEKFQSLDADNRFVYGATLDLPVHLQEGNYYLAMKVDSANVVEEFDETNNYFFSDEPAISIVRLPDLVVEDLSVIFSEDNPGGYFVYGEELELSFTIRNAGLADAPATPFRTEVFLTPSRDLSDGGDDLVSFVEASGLPRGQSRTYRVTAEIPQGTRIGDYLSAGVLVDSEESIRESREDNNGLLSEDRNIFISELPIDVAVDNIGTEFKFPSGRIPWIGQTEESFDGVHAARSGRTGHGGRSEFETTVNLDSPSFVSFYWKVSSERVESPDLGLKEDFLRFSINGVEQRRISGEVDWTRVSFPLPAGSSTLTWSYVKDATGSAGRDAGWVDRITYDVPDLVVADLEYSPGTYSPGQEFPVSLRLRNQGNSAVPVSRPFHVQIRLSRDLVWGGEDDIIIDTFSVPELGMNETREINRFPVIPSDIAFNEDYYLAAFVDSGNVIVESNEDNNELFSSARNITLVPTVTLEEALDDEINEIDPGWLDSGWRSGGALPWFGQADRELADGSQSTSDGTDAAQSGNVGVNEESWIEREIEVAPEGPAEVVFRWKVSSLPSANFLRFSISGAEQARISGEVDWREERFLIPSGPQVLRWSYVKNNSRIEGEDAAWLDQVEILPLDEPDLVITDVEFEPGEYVLQRDFFPIQVTVQNRGADLQGVDWDASDIAVRLSLDQTWGNSDDVILGNFARVDTFESGNRLVFSGDISLPLDTPAGNYYLAVLADPFEKVEEYDRENNFFWSPSRSVTIERLPNLVIADDGYRPPDGTKIYYPQSTLEFDFNLRNIGLGDVPGGVPYTQRIELKARKLEDAAPDYNWITDAERVKVVAEFIESAFLPGISEERPEGSKLSYRTRLMLPDELELLKALDIVPEEATRSTISDGNRRELDEWEFSLILAIDATDAIRESDEANVAFIQGIGLFPIHPLLRSQPYHDFDRWVAEYGVQGGPLDVMTDDGITNLMKYALNLNPLRTERNPFREGPSGAQAIGVIDVDGESYFRLSFDLVKGSVDLSYIVEVSSNLSDWEPLITIDPPFNEEHGGRSLTGVGGLSSEPLVIGVSDEGYTGSVTVRDVMPVAQESQRFLRLRIEQKDP